MGRTDADDDDTDARQTAAARCGIIWIGQMDYSDEVALQHAALFTFPKRKQQMQHVSEDRC